MESMDLNFEVEALKQTASERTSLQDFGSSFFERPLAAWVSDLQSPILNDFGRDFMRRLAVSNLQRRLEIIDCLTRHPEILAVKLPPIILITGFARTGTTLLHNLIFQHSEARALLRWELMKPVPPPEQATYHIDPRIVQVQASIEPLRGSQLEKMHWVNADEPEECPWGFYDCTGFLGYGCWPVMPQWWAWITHNELKSTFIEHRQLIQLLLWKNPPPQGSFLVLKSPVTALQIDIFASVFPEAKYLFTHRDPYRALVSSCTVLDAVCQPFDAQGQRLLAHDGLNEQQVFCRMRDTFAKLVAFAQMNPNQVANVHYSELMADSIGTTGQALTQLGFTMSDTFEQSILNFLDKQRGHRAAPPKFYETYGYEQEQVWSDPDITNYVNSFGVQQEFVRLTDTKAL